MAKRVITQILIVICLLIAFPIGTIAEKEMPFDCSNVAAIALGFPGSVQIMLAKEQNTPLCVAGLTRMGAMLLISEALDNNEFPFDKDVTVSSAASKIVGPTAFIEVNEIISVENLYKSMVMINAGDATYALAEAIFGSMDVFVKKLNERMSALGVSVVYSTPLGDEMNMTIEDVAKIAFALSKSRTYLSYSNRYMDKIIHTNNKKETQLVNPNRLIRDMVGCTGLATGSSTQAGYCGAFSVTRAETTYICVVLGAKTSAQRFEMVKTAIEYAFASYKVTRIATVGEIMFEKMQLNGGMERSVNLVALNELAILTSQAEELPKGVYNVPKTLNAPLRAGEIIGNVDYFDSQGNRLGTLELGVDKDIVAVTYFDYIKLIMSHWIGMV